MVEVHKFSKILGASMVTRRKFYNEGPQILGARATCLPGYVQYWPRNMVLHIGMAYVDKLLQK